MAASPGAYPVSFTSQPAQKIGNWRALVHWIMLVPHMIVLYVLGLVGSVISLISWFAIMFTGNMPEGMANYQIMMLRYQNRIMKFNLLFHDQYPPFDFDTVATDPGTTPERTDAVAQLTGRNRLTVFFRLFMIIPHMIALGFVMIGGYFAFLIGWFAVLFTGKLPDGIANFLLGIGRWFTRVTGYYNLLTDEFPPFSLD